MLVTESSHAPMFPRARMRAAEAFFRASRAEIMAVVMRQAEAGDRVAMGLARRHGLPVEPPLDVLAARLAESIERTRATVATLVAEGGLDIGTALRVPPRAPPQPTHPAREGGDLYFPVNSEDETAARQKSCLCAEMFRSAAPVFPC